MGGIQSISASASKKSSRQVEEGSKPVAAFLPDSTLCRDDQQRLDAGSNPDEGIVADAEGVDGREQSSLEEQGELQLEDGTASDLARSLTEIEIPFDSQPDANSEKDDESESRGEGDVYATCLILSNGVSGDYIQASTKLKVYSSQDIHFDGIIGEGEFGRVTKAILHGKSTLQVAIKVFHAHLTFVNAPGQLKTITNLKHRNVVAILGILESTLTPDTASQFGPRILFQYFPEGNLLQYLSRRSTERELASNPGTLVKLLLDVAQGCEYLHSHGVVHGNLAARNILVEKQFGKSLTHYYNAKVSDYGIMHLVTAKGVGKNYIRVDNGLVVPIRHVPAELLAPESRGFTFQSDVWSFGVVLWEALTKGAIPYGKRKEDSMVMRLIKSGMSPTDVRVPEGYPQELIDIMNQCFQVNPEKRPTFTELTNSMSQHLANYMTTTTSPPSTETTPSGSYVSEEKAGVSEQMEGPLVVVDVKSERRSSPPSSMRRRGYRSGQGRTRRPPHSRKSESNVEEAAPLIASSSRPPRGSRGSSISTRQRPAFSRKSESPQGSSIPGTYQTCRQSNTSQLGVRLSPLPLMSVAPPPPPYTANPPPNHSSMRGPLPPRSSSCSGSTRPPPRAPRRPIDYDLAIQRKTRELEQLKVRKLQQEASNTWNKMHSLVSQLTNLHTSNLASSSSSGPTRSSTRSTSDYQYRRARGGGGGGGAYETGPRSSHASGGVRGRSYGRGSSSKFPPRFGPRNTPDYTM